MGQFLHKFEALVVAMQVSGKLLHIILYTHVKPTTDGKVSGKVHLILAVS